jgi:hypothetical protein
MWDLKSARCIPEVTFPKAAMTGLIKFSGIL